MIGISRFTHLYRALHGAWCLLNKVFGMTLPLPAARAPNNTDITGQSACLIYDVAANVSALGGATAGKAVLYCADDSPYDAIPSVDGGLCNMLSDRYQTNPTATLLQLGATTLCPYYDLVALPGGPCLLFGGGRLPPSYTVASTYLFTQGGNVDFGASNFSIWGFGRFLVDGTILCAGDDTTNGFTLKTTASGAFKWTVANAVCSFNVDTPETTWLADGGVHWFVLSFCSNDSGNLNAFELVVDGKTLPLIVTLAAQSGGTLAAEMTLGANADGTNPVQMALGYVAFTNYRPTSVEIDAWVQYLAQTYPQAFASIAQGIPTRGTEAARIGVTTCGDSIASGTGNSRDFADVNVAVTNLGSRFLPPRAKNNFAVYGTKLVVSTVLPDFLAVNDQIGLRVTRALYAGATNVVVLEGGTNDLGSGIDAPTTIAAWATCINAAATALNAIANGAPQHVFVKTITIDGNFTGGEETNRQTVNAALIATWDGTAIGATTVHVVDLGGDPVLGNAYGGDADSPVKPYFIDRAHFTTFGAARAAAILMAKIQAVGL